MKRLVISFAGSIVYYIAGAWSFGAMGRLDPKPSPQVEELFLYVVFPPALPTERLLSCFGLYPWNYGYVTGIVAWLWGFAVCFGVYSLWNRLSHRREDGLKAT